MPAINFQARFADKVKNREKRQATERRATPEKEGRILAAGFSCSPSGVHLCDRVDSREVIARVLEEWADDPWKIDHAPLKLRSGEWTPEALK